MTSGKNGRIRTRNKSGDVIYHRPGASKAAIRRAAKGRFVTVRLKKGISIARDTKALH